MQHAAFNRVLETHRIDGEATVVGANKAFDPHVAGFAVYFYIGDYRHYGVAAIRVSDAAPALERLFHDRLELTREQRDRVTQDVRGAQTKLPLSALIEGNNPASG